MAESRICSIPDCGKRVLGRGWCAAHYRRWRIHGAPLGGGPTKTPNGEVYRYFRDVVLTYDGNECLLWPFARTKNGYGTIHVDGRRQIVSRVVCESVNGAPPTPKHEAAHSCGNGRNACVSKQHLDWKTRAGNAADMVEHGNSTRGHRHALVKLTQEQVLEIRALQGKDTQDNLAKRFGVSRQAISAIHSGRNWNWL